MGNVTPDNLSNEEYINSSRQNGESGVGETTDTDVEEALIKHPLQNRYNLLQF